MRRYALWAAHQRSLALNLSLTVTTLVSVISSEITDLCSDSLQFYRELLRCDFVSRYDLP